ncbi:MAG TPA: hypothetical protein VFJ71_10745 [Candidatus Limnocylindrales bacterium]|nr:hypothetical protein [Candidatus Limnocylindrales bacterium]
MTRDLGQWQLEGSWFRLHGAEGGPVARLDDADGSRWAELRMLASVDPLGGIDETLAVDGPEIAEDAAAVRLVWRLASSTWDAKRIVLEATPGGLGIHVEVEGRAAIGAVSLLAGRVVTPRATGTVMSGAWFESVVSGGPADPGRIVGHATESADIGVVSGSEPGRGGWFFTPGPFVYAVSRSPAGAGVTIPPGPWLGFGLGVAPGDAGFTGFGYRALDRGFGFAFDYEGKTAVDGTWRSPTVLIRAAADPYDAIAGWRDALVAGGWARAPRPRHQPAWWLEPIFCGWGAQGALARSVGLTWAASPGYATQASYDRFLAELDDRGIRPGTVVIDDKWQAAYGVCEPDTTKWPDLRGWIAGRHAAGQRVLLWYKAWDAEGLPGDWCVRSTSGVPLGIDPTNPDGEAAVRRAIRRMVASDGLDADGLKLDLTARTPSGVATTHRGGAWGVDLLRRLLEIVADEARAVRPDALIIGQTPNPLLAPSVDMIRLNDMLRLDDPRPLVDVVPQMRHRAAIARAATPELPIDTDDWCVPDLAGWRAYTAIKAELGVPALYYTTTIDLTGEPLADEDFALTRRVWADYRAGRRT